MPMPKAHQAVRKDRPARAADPYYSRAVGKALQVLDLLRTGRESAPLHEIARRIQLSKTSAFRLIRTLQLSGCLAVNQAGEYRLETGFQAVARTQWLGKLLRSAIPRMQTLERELGETVSLAALFENRSEVVAVVESTQTIRMSNVAGHILPPNASSLGKVITAFQTLERREKLIRSFGAWKLTPHTITDAVALRQEFDRVRASKFAADREETVSGGICFGVPIFESGGEVLAALSASFPKQRVGGADHERRIVALLHSTAAAIAADLQGSPDNHQPAPKPRLRLSK
jgi:IclR family acetate operon transcriptional repressor